jgi:hypothetical protein
MAKTPEELALEAKWEQQAKDDDERKQKVADGLTAARQANENREGTPARKKWRL